MLMFGIIQIEFYINWCEYIKMRKKFSWYVVFEDEKESYVSYYIKSVKI